MIIRPNKKLSSLFFALVALNYPHQSLHAEDFEVAKVATLPPIQDDLSGKLAFVVESVIGKNKTSTIVTSDVNGDNASSVFQINGGIQSLAVQPNGRSIIFTATRPNEYPLVYMADVFTRVVSTLTPYRANHAGASLSNDGKLLFSSDREGNLDIYLADITGGSPQRIISSPASDTSPYWSPDGQSFIFTSDRAGGFNRPRLYRYTLSTGSTQALPYGGYSAEGRYSADGKKIVFVSGSRGAIADVGGGVRIVSGMEEAPGISPNGQNLVYSNGSALTITTPIRSFSINPTTKIGIKGKITKPVWLKDQL